LTTVECRVFQQVASHALEGSNVFADKLAGMLAHGQVLFLDLRSITKHPDEQVFDVLVVGTLSMGATVIYDSLGFDTGSVMAAVSEESPIGRYRANPAGGY